jgi:hypothetical protein
VTPVPKTSTLTATKTTRSQIKATSATVTETASSRTNATSAAAAADEAIMVALNTAVAVAVALDTAVADPDSGKMSSLTISGNETAVDITGTVSGSDSSIVDSGAALKLSPVSDKMAGTLTENGTIEAINGKPAGAVSETGAFKIDAGAALQLESSHAVNGLVRTNGTNADAINLPGDHTTKTAWHVSDDGRGGKTAHNAPASETGEDPSAQSTPADNHFTVSSPFTEALSGNGDHSASPFKPNADHHATADPGINLDSIPKDHVLQHPADNSLHTPAQHDDNGSPAVTDGAHPAHPHFDENQSAGPRFADDGSAQAGNPHDPPAPTALSSDLSGDDSAHPFKTNSGNHASSDPEINDVANNHPLQQPADNSLYTPGQHDDSGSPVVSDGTHPADQVDGKQLDSFKFADNGGSHPETGPGGGHTPDPQIDRNQLRFVDDGGTHPGTGPDGVHTAHPQVGGNPLDSFKFADNDSAHPGTVVPHDSPTLTALLSDSSGTHGPAAPDVAKTFDVPGTVISDAASDKFIFGKNLSHDTIADHKPDMVEIDHTVPADIQHLLDTAHDTNAVSTLDPNHATAIQDMTKVQPHHQSDFHFA